MELKIKRPRVVSAKYQHPRYEQQRPFSGVSTQTYKRQDLIDNVYTSQVNHPVRALSAKHHQTGKPPILFIDNERKMHRPVKKSKQKQEMAQEILILKQTINKLTEQLSQQRGRVQNMKRKNSQYSKVLTMQFENQKQWGSHAVSSHLVTGIKAMYDSLKQKYENKNKQFDNLVFRLQTSNYLQMNSYIEALQKNNQQLSNKLQLLVRDSLQFPVTTDTNKMASSYMVTQLKVFNQKLYDKNKELEANLKQKNSSNKDQDQKLQFLQKLIIQKDNNIYALQRKVKQETNHSKALRDDLAIAHKQFEDVKAEFQKATKTYGETLAQINSERIVEVEEARHQNDKLISNLEKNNHYYQETIIEMRKSNTKLNSQLQDFKEQKVKLSLQQKPKKMQRRQTISKPMAKLQHQDDSLKKAQVVVEGGIRMPQRANQRYSEQALKKRKVQLGEVLQISELLRFKMLVKKISLQEFKTFFDKNPAKEYEDSEWSEKYITMQEIIDVLQEEPIKLGSEPSLQIARYIIEDVNQQYVYCDIMNQNGREVVKSIIKTLIKPYPTHQGSKMDQQCDTILEQYGPNLKLTLQTLYPGGFISKSKFQTILKSLGIQISLQSREYLIGRMALNSEDIEELPYSVLF